MQFSDATNKNGILQVSEVFTGLGDAGITGDSVRLKQFTELVNIRYDDVWSMILASQNGWDIDDPNLDNRDFIKSFGIVKDQQYIDLDIQTNNILKIKHVQIKYTSDGTFYKAEPMDVGELGIAKDPTTVAQVFDKTKPFYDLQGKWMYFFPIPDITVASTAVDVHFTREFDRFLSTDTTQEPGFDNQFHRMLPIGAALDWLGIHKPDSKLVRKLERDWARMSAQLMAYYGTKNEDRHITMRSAFVDYE